METIEERADKAYPMLQRDYDDHYEQREGYIKGATEMEQNPSDALIMRILNCIGYEEEGWIEFVRKELEKRKDDNSADAAKINPLLAECLSEVNPDTRAEVRKNMDADHFRDTTKSPLTWQDVQRICRLEAQVASSFEFGDADKVSGKEFYTEVLKRFNTNN